MADNVDITPGTGATVASDEVQVSGTHAIGQVQFVKLVDGTLNGTDAIAGTAADGLLVNLGANNDVTIDAGAVTSLALIDDPVVVDDAAFTLGTGKVMMAGKSVVAHGSNPDAADAGDAGSALMNRHRIPFVLGGHPNILTLRATYTGAQTDTAVVSVSTGSKIVVTQAQVTVSNATTATPSMILGFGTANTPTTTNVVMAHPGIPGGGGVSRGDGSGILGIGADDADLRITISVPTGGALDIVVSYFTIES